MQLTINACLLLFLLRNPRFPISFEFSRSFRVSSATEFSLRFSLSVSFPLEFSFFPARLVFSFSARSGVTFLTRPELTFSTGFEFSFPTRFIFFSFPELRLLFSFRLFLFFSCFFLTLELLVFSVKDFIFAEFTFQWPFGWLSNQSGRNTLPGRREPMPRFLQTRVSGARQSFGIVRVNHWWKYALHKEGW